MDADIDDDNASILTLLPSYSSVRDDHPRRPDSPTPSYHTVNQEEVTPPAAHLRRTQPAAPPHYQPALSAQNAVIATPFSADRRREVADKADDQTLYQMVHQILQDWRDAYVNAAQFDAVLIPTLALLTLLLEKGANINDVHPPHGTPLHAAVRYTREGQSILICWLLNHGALVNACDGDGLTPLDLALCMSSVEFVEVLLRFGADLNQRTTSSLRSPLHRAVDLGRQDFVQMLLDRGAVGDTIDSFGRTPLHLAARNGRGKSAELLIAKGVCSCITDYEGNTPLHLAILHGHADTARLLIARAVKGFDQENAFSETPLRLAVRRSMLVVVEQLCAAGCAIDARVLRAADVEQLLELSEHLYSRIALTNEQTAAGRSPTPIALAGKQSVSVYRLLQQTLHARDRMRPAR